MAASSPPSLLRRANSSDAAEPHGHQDISSTMILGSHLSSPNWVRPLKALPPRSEHTMLPLFLETPCGATKQPLLEQVGINCVSAHTRLQPWRLWGFLAGKKGEVMGHCHRPQNYLGWGRWDWHGGKEGYLITFLNFRKWDLEDPLVPKGLLESPARMAST